MDSSDSTYNNLNSTNSDKNFLSSDDYFYYSQILEHIKESTSESEDPVRESTLESINESENIKILLKNKKISSILDTILPTAPPSNYINIIKTFEEDLRIYAVDCFASHVLETILKLCLKHLQHSKGNASTESNNVPEDERKYLTNFLIKSCKFICNNVAEFMTETYASHVLRTVMEVITGIEVPRQLLTKINSNIASSIWKIPPIVPKEISELLPNLINRLCNLPNFLDVTRNQCGSAVLQCALSILHSSPSNKKLLKNLVNSIINNGFSEFSDENELHEVFTILPCCRLLEAVMVVATDKQQTFIYESFFKHKLNQICVHKNGNFAVQKLFDNCKNPEFFNEIYPSVVSSLESSLRNGYNGIFLSLVKACIRFELNQSKVMKCIMDILQCAEPVKRQDSIAILLMKFVKFDDIAGIKDHPFQLHGVLIVQEILRSKKSKKIVNSILNMTCIELVDVACDSKASHVISVFMDSETILHKKKKQLLDKFQELEVDLSCSKSGSRSLEALWKFADLETKAEIAKRLLKSEKKLLSNTFGKIIFNIFHLSIFSNQTAWKDGITRVNEKRKINEELLNSFQASHKRMKS